MTRFKFFRREIPVSPRARDRWLEAAVLGGLIGLFLAVAAVFPVVPGMIPESHVENVKLSLRVMQLLQEQSLWTLFIEGKLPASWSPSQPYQGALMAYLYLPVFYLVGANLAIAEYWHFLFVVPTLALVYFLMKQMFGRAAGMLAVLFLVVHPGYVAGTRLGVYFLGYLHFFSVGSLYFLYRWRQTGRTAYFCLGFLLLGMGMSLLSIFYWYVAALAAAALLYRSEFFGQGALRAVKLAGAGLAAAAAGAALNIYQEFVSGGAGIGTLLRHATREDNPNSLWNYFRRLPEMAVYVTESLAGLDWRMFCWPDHLLHSPVRINEYLPWDGNVAFAALMWLSAAFLFWRARKRKDAALLPAVLVGITLMTPLSTYGVHMHLFILYPFPQMVLAAAAVELAAVLAGRPRVLGLAAVAWAAFLVMEVRGVVRLFGLYDYPVLNYPTHPYDVYNYGFVEEPRDVQKVGTLVQGSWRWPGLLWKDAKRIPLRETTDVKPDPPVEAPRKPAEISGGRRTAKTGGTRRARSFDFVPDGAYT